MKLIVAIDERFGIGRDNIIPWHVPADLKLFQKATTGKYVVMGRNTFDSLRRRPLPNRTNIVISTTLTQPKDGSYEVFSSLDDFVEAFGAGDDIFVIGGSRLYREALESGYVDSILLSNIPGNHHCTVQFYPPDYAKETERTHHFCDKSKTAFTQSVLSVDKTCAMYFEDLSFAALSKAMNSGKLSDVQLDCALSSLSRFPDSSAVRQLALPFLKSDKNLVVESAIYAITRHPHREVIETLRGVASDEYRAYPDYIKHAANDALDEILELAFGEQLPC